MPGSAAHTFFAIPELFCLLSAHVPQSDLTQCSLVCKEWSRQFQPKLWVNVIFTERFMRLINEVPSPAATALTRNLGHIREVIFPAVNPSHLQLLIQGLPEQLNDTVTEPKSLCTNLRLIYFRTIDSDRLDRLDFISKPLLTLLNNNLRLTYLYVFVDILNIEGFSAALSKLQHLQHLTVHSDSETDYIPEPLLFLRSCLGLPELTELHFESGVEIHWDDGDEATIRRELEAVIHEASVVRFSGRDDAKKIKQVTFPSNCEKRRNPLPLLLLKSNLLDLQECVIPGFGPDASLQEIEQVVREHCSEIKHLEFSDVHEANGPAVRAFIRGCSGLRSFTSLPYNECLEDEPLLVLSELVSWHRTTLEILDIQPVGVSSHYLQEILSCCMQLKRFHAMATDWIGVSSITYWDMSRSDWVCTKLRELYLTVNRWSPERDEQEEVEQTPDGRHLCSDRCRCTSKRAFQQIGRLEMLEVLDISIDR
ncbi:hypothetical protein BGZ70_005256, partial [Mortierella alpina]